LSGFQVIEPAGTSRQKWLCCFTLMGIQRAARDFIRIFVTVIGLRLKNHLDSFTQNLFAGSHKCQLITKTRARDFPNRFLCRQQNRRLRRDWNNIKVLNVLGPPNLAVPISPELDVAKASIKKVGNPDNAAI
jgi:hypothetical protein